MPRLGRKRLLIPTVLLPVVAAGFLATTQIAASAAANPGPGFPAHFAAPYAEMWNSSSTLMAAANATGNKYYTLAFIISQGTCNASINGDTPITDAGWNSAINSLRAAGGDVIASFGGAGGTELSTCSTVASMQAQYKRVIDQMNLTMIDLDIEGGTLGNTAANDRRNTALANLQAEYAAQGRTLKVNYTLPVNPTGLESNSIALLNNAKSHNLNVNAVNIMTMDYGPAMDMGQAAIQAANALHTQLGQIWNTKTSAQLWAMEGNTPMIGVNDTAAEIFTTQDASELAAFAAQNGIQLLAFWSLGRDNQGSSGTAQSQYQFTNTFKTITGGTTPTNPPTNPTTPPPTGGGTLLSQGHPATASSTENSTFGAAMAVDGNTGTRWSSAFSDPQWIQVDLGATHTISRVVLNWEAAAASAFQIQTSANGTTWTNVYSTTSGAGGTQNLTVSGSGRYVRVNGTTRNTQWGYSLWEFQVFGS